MSTRNSEQPDPRRGDASRISRTEQDVVGESTERVESGRTMELREEELRAHKQAVEAGEVRLRKDVVTEQRTIDVPVTHEEVSIERHAVDRRPSDGPIGEGGETVRVPVREEQVSVEKRPVVTEEVEIGKRQVQETKQVSGTVRREEVRVEGQGDVEVDKRR